MYEIGTNFCLSHIARRAWIPLQKRMYYYYWQPTVNIKAYSLLQIFTAHFSCSWPLCIRFSRFSVVTSGIDLAGCRKCLVYVKCIDSLFKWIRNQPMIIRWLDSFYELLTAGQSCYQLLVGYCSRASLDKVVIHKQIKFEFSVKISVKIMLDFWTVSFITKAAMILSGLRFMVL